MAHQPINRVISQLCNRFGEPADGLVADQVLLCQFAEQKDEIAFAQLMDRHGDLVWGVCQRILGHVQDAEDAFQATFLVLARKAAAIAKKASLRCWLHGVANRVALNAKRAAAVRQDREGRSEPRLHGNISEELTWKEVRQVLDEEAARLPEKYRLPLLLCYLDGKTQDEAARQLGWGRDVFRGRLDRGRERLHQRLAQRGLGLSAALTAMLVAQGVSKAAVPAALKTATIEAATLSAAGSISAPVAALVEGVLRSMLLTKIKWTAALVLSFSVLIAGAGLVVQPAGAVTEPDAPQVAQAPQPKPSRPKVRLDLYGDPLPQGAMARLGTVRGGHRAPIQCMAFTPDSKTLFSYGNDNTIRSWDAAVGKEVRRFHQPLIFYAQAAFAPDGKTAAFLEHQTLYLWDLAAGKEIRRASLPFFAFHLAFAPEGKTLALGETR